MSEPTTEVTEVITTDVRPGQEEAYRDWAARIQQAQSAFAGYRGSFVQPPRSGERSWTTLMRFASVEALETWMASPERLALLREAEALVEREMLHRVDSSFPGWIPNDPVSGKPPKLWKTGCLVLLTLYPVVMLEIKFLTPVLVALQLAPALATFVGNAISVGLTTWPLMPLAIRAFRPWIFSDEQPRNTELVGTVVIVGCYALELAVFWRLLG